MRVLFFHRWVGVHGGGTETHLLELAKRFSGLGHEVTILTRAGNRLIDLDNKIKVIRISRGLKESDHSYEDFRVYVYTIAYMFKSLLKLFELRLRGQKFDLVSVHFAVEAIIARIFRFLTGTPFVFVLEGYTPLEAKTARYADARIAISRFEAGVYRQKFGVEAEVIHIGIDTQRFSLKANDAEKLRQDLIGDAELLVLSVCRIEPRKDLFTLLNAAAFLKSRDRKVKFIIVGEGISQEPLRQAIKEKSIQDEVAMVGFVKDEELPRYYAAADVFLLTSKEEWFGIVFLEAMASGLPVISTNVDACPEVVGECGLFFEKGDYRELAEKIITLHDSLQLRSELSSRARQRAMNFDWDRQIILYEKAYQDVLRKINV